MCVCILYAISCGGNFLEKNYHLLVDTPTLPTACTAHHHKWWRPAMPEPPQLTEAMAWTWQGEVSLQKSRQCPTLLSIPEPLQPLTPKVQNQSRTTENL